MAKITELMDKVVLGEKPQREDTEIIRQLKEKFLTTSERSVKVQILTVLPMSWSVERIQTEFGASNYMVRKAKQLVKQDGILSSPDPKPSRPSLSEKAVGIVISFYENDSSSRMMPGKKDFVSVKSEQGRVHVQRRLILSNLRELYRNFKDTYPAERIGFSKFAQLRPKHCILAGASGTHSVCVCTIHQNVKLMIQGVKLEELVSGQPTSYHHCIAKIICNPPLTRCYLGKCDFCPGIQELKDDFAKTLNDNVIENVTFKQWTAVDRSTLVTLTLPSDEFVDALCEKLETLKTHSFIATQQSKFYEHCKQSLKAGEVVVSADFSENYAFVVQDAAQGFHWNNSQSTIHPFVVYYKVSSSCSISQRSYVVISDCLHHDTIAVYLFQKRLVSFLKATIGRLPKRIFYFSDGAASQYKNRKNFLNLCFHQADYGVPAESATSHGKGACDGVGGTVKRL